MIKCNGVSAHAHAYTDRTRSVFMDNIAQIRQRYQLGIEQSRGRRFMSDDIVFLTLRSWATEDEFVRTPTPWIMAALEDCAERDWWYKFEKVWEEKE